MPALKFLSLFLVGFAFVLASGDLGVTTRSIKCYHDGEVIQSQIFGLYYSNAGPFNLRSEIFYSL